MHTEIVTLSGPSGEGRRRATATSAPAGPCATVPRNRRARLDGSHRRRGRHPVRRRQLDRRRRRAASPCAATAAAGWTEWAELEADPDDGPDDWHPRQRRHGRGSAPTASTTSRSRWSSGDLADLELQPMRYEAPTGLPPSSPRCAGASAAQPEIIPRTTYTSKGWASSNSGCSNGPISATGGVKFAVVHHTVNANTYDRRRRARDAGLDLRLPHGYQWLVRHGVQLHRRSLRPDLGGPLGRHRPSRSSAATPRASTPAASACRSSASSSRARRPPPPSRAPRPSRPPPESSAGSSGSTASTPPAP